MELVIEMPQPGAQLRVPGSVIHLLHAAADRRPQGRAIDFEGASLTYGELAGVVGALARRLARRAGPGERVAVLMQNSLDLAVATYAVHSLRAQVAALNPAYGPQELAQMLADSRPCMVLHDETVRHDVRELCPWLPHDAVIATRGGAAFAGLRSEACPLPAELPAHEDLATLQYTGGTTGRPKGVNILHRQIAWNLAQREAWLPTCEGDEVILCTTPLFHVSAVAMCLHLALMAGSPIVIQRRFDARRVLETVAAERVTRMSGVPTIFYDLLRNLRPGDRALLGSLRTCYSGAAPLPTETLRQFEEATGCPIFEGYGASEAGPCLTYNPVHLPRKAGSVGLPVPASQLRIVDVDTGAAITTPGRSGEVQVHGPHVMAGYRNLDEETAAVLRDGWYCTGDVGSLDVDGYLTLHGRRHDTINVGGYKVYPLEVERVLLACPEVGEAAAFAAPDERLGQVVHAWVTAAGGATPDAQALIGRCKAQLAPYKVPRRIGLIAQLPRTAVGKLARSRLEPVAA
jgi:long-chain acyl-CoA synthetase